ncbi:MAG TPA: DUF4097 family beta strand repeat-containing protein [Blastocatellia bacterium]|nr:DUF4097 family beta strand repeat-containing protein [Blastocatellia bacterium]
MKQRWPLLARFILHLALRSVLVVGLTTSAQPGSAQSACEFHRTLSVTASDPVTLDVQLTEGELQIGYGRNEQVSVAAIAEVPIGAKADRELLATALAVEQAGNHLRIRRLSSVGPGEGKIKIVVRIDVPYLTEVHSVVDNGKQTITGIMGPVKARTSKGDIKVSYVSKGVLAEAGSGNLDLEVIGERVEARTGNGNISCIRAVQGSSAETEDGDIVLMVVGPSTARVKKGTGRIDLTGARGSFTGSTIEGDLHVKAMPHDDWRLTSASGNIRVELPPSARFEVDATTNLGEVLINRDDIEKSDAEARHLHQKVNGGGKRVEVRTDSGKIVIR